VSGPDIFAPVSGSNAIGSFAIGVSPIGSIIPFNYWDTIISQYANSSIMTTLIGDFDSWLDQTANFDALYDNVWNVTTAQGYGLDVWGRIVGLIGGRTLQIVGSQNYLTFEETGSGFGFGQQPLFSGQPVTSNYQLADPDFRTLIYAKALANISDGSIKSINAILRALFPSRGNAYVTDGLNMTMTYTFDFALTLPEQAIVENSGVLPRPLGVKSSVVITA
jgi:hypothetical protein